MSKTCTVEGCNGKHEAKGYCKKHYQQYKRHGHVLQKTIYDLNEIIEYDDYAEIILYDKYGNEKARTKIDLDDVERCSKFRWGLTDRDKYVETRNPRIKLHRFIMNPESNMVIDHINGDGLDNRKENLRICEQIENMKNLSTPITNTSGCKGVSFQKNTNKWHAYITCNKRRITLGYYSNFEDAVMARKQAEIDYFGEYAPNRED